MAFIQHPSLSLAIYEFTQGAKEAAKFAGINIIVDTFRASNVAIALLEVGTDIFPASSFEEALEMECDFIVGDMGRKVDDDLIYDNSPVDIVRDANKLRGKKIVHRSSNGTRGLIASVGAEKILIMSPRNLEVVATYCQQQLELGEKVFIIPMGSSINPEKNLEQRVEDMGAAQFLYNRILEKVGIEMNQEFPTDFSTENLRGLIRVDHRFQIQTIHRAKKDFEYCTTVNATDVIIPVYDVESNQNELPTTSASHVVGVSYESSQLKP